MLTLPEAAARLGVKRQWVWQLVKAGTLKAEKTGRDWLIEEAEVERYEQERRPAHRPKRDRNEAPKTKIHAARELSQKDDQDP